MKKHAAFGFLFAPIYWLGFNLAHGQATSIIPTPVQVQIYDGNYKLESSTIIAVRPKNAATVKIAGYFNERIKQATGYELKIVETEQPRGLEMILNTKPDTRLGQEGYTLKSTTNKITIQANTAGGLFYGVQTLLQLLPKEIESKTLIKNILWQIPLVDITDYPRFAWRGIMLDVSRHFFSKEYIKDYIDQLATYKFNIFHWHLTDDQGWRIEIKSLPKLTSIGAWRVPRPGGTFGTHEAPKRGEAATDGGFYTHEDIKEIVQYASERNIQVLPEIDVPGHSMAAIAAYPELSCTKDTSTRVNPGSKFSTWFGNGKFKMDIDNTLNPSDEKVYQFLDKVFAEVAMLFPFEYIHIGGDECYKGYWEKDAGCQAFMKKMKISDTEKLQSYFSQRVSKILSSHGKKTIGWDEILEGGLASGAAVMSWRGTKGGIEATHLKHPVVMSPSPLYYLDMYQGESSIEAPVYGSARLKDVYKMDILPAGIDSTFVLGGQGNLWTEQIPSVPQIEYMTYPRAFAIAETLWSHKSKKDWNNFVTRVEYHFERFNEARRNYARSMYDPIISVTKNSRGNLEVNLSTEVDGLTLYYTIDNTIPNQYYPKYKEPIVLPKGTDMFRVISYKENKPAGRLISLKVEDLEKRVKK